MTEWTYKITCNGVEFQAQHRDQTVFVVYWTKREGFVWTSTQGGGLSSSVGARLPQHIMQALAKFMSTRAKKTLTRAPASRKAIS